MTVVNHAIGHHRAKERFNRGQKCDRECIPKQLLRLRKRGEFRQFERRPALRNAAESSANGFNPKTRIEIEKANRDGPKTERNDRRWKTPRRMAEFGATYRRRT